MFVAMLFVAFLAGTYAETQVESEAHTVATTDAEVQTIAAYLVKRCEKRKAAEAPSMLVTSGGVLHARKAMQEAEVMKEEVANLGGGLHLPVEVAAKEKGFVYYVTMLVQYRTASEMMYQLNPWPQWEVGNVSSSFTLLKPLLCRTCCTISHIVIGPCFVL